MGTPFTSKNVFLAHNFNFVMKTEQKCVERFGDHNPAITASYSTNAVTDGIRSPSATVQNFSNAATKKRSSPASTCGENCQSYTEEIDSPANCNGDYSQSEALRSNATSNGNHSKAITHGKGCSSIVTGNYGIAIAYGIHSVAFCSGAHGKAFVGPNGMIILASHFDLDNKELICGRIGEELKQYTFYELDDNNKFIISLNDIETQSVLTFHDLSVFKN